MLCNTPTTKSFQNGSTLCSKKPEKFSHYQWNQCNMVAILKIRDLNLGIGLISESFWYYIKLLQYHIEGFITKCKVRPHELSANTLRCTSQQMPRRTVIETLTTQHTAINSISQAISF